MQRAAIHAIYEEVGFARSLLCYEMPDGRLKLIDGHLRRDIDPDMEVEVVFPSSRVIHHRAPGHFSPFSLQRPQSAPCPPRRTAPMSLLDVFFATLIQTPGDWLTRAALADWYEENGHDRIAECVHWMVRHHYRPSVNAIGMAFWFDAPHALPYTEIVAHLPSPLFRALTPQVWYRSTRSYNDLRAAEEDLHAAWSTVRAAGLWTPD
jgi:hypothetical protein